MRNLTVFFFGEEAPITVNNVVDFDVVDDMATIHAHQMDPATTQAQCVDIVIPSLNIKFIQVVTEHDNSHTTH